MLELCIFFYQCHFSYLSFTCICQLQRFSQTSVVWNLALCSLMINKKDLVFENMSLCIWALIRHLMFYFCLSTLWIWTELTLLDYLANYINLIRLSSFLFNCIWLSFLQKLVRRCLFNTLYFFWKSDVRFFEIHWRKNFSVGAKTIQDWNGMWVIQKNDPSNPSHCSALLADLDSTKRD